MPDVNDPTYLRAFHKIVQRLPKKQRQDLEFEIRRVQELFGDELDLVQDRRGQHWPELREKRKKLAPLPEVEFEIRGRESFLTTINDAAKLLHKTPHSVRLKLLRGEGITNYVNDLDEIITIRRLTKCTIDFSQATMPPAGQDLS